jgi:hypothetical protein
VRQNETIEYMNSCVLENEPQRSTPQRKKTILRVIQKSDYAKEAP